MMALAGQMALGHEQPWLPDALGNRRIDRKGLTAMAEGGRKWLGWIETFSKPRLTTITGPKSERLIGILLCIFCASILVPLPMTNTIPGFAVALAAFGTDQPGWLPGRDRLRARPHLGVFPAGAWAHRGAGCDPFRQGLAHGIVRLVTLRRTFAGVTAC